MVENRMKFLIILGCTLLIRATPVCASEPENKNLLIKELMHDLSIDLQIKKAVDGTSTFFDNRPKAKDPVVEVRNAKIFAKAKVKYESEKSKIQENATQKMAAEFDHLFSQAEIKYLVGLTKYPIVLKLVTFLYSDKYQDIINAQAVGASSYLKEARQEVLLEEKNKKTKK